MRMAFGLVGLLVTVGVIIMIMNYYSLPVAKTAVQTKKKVEQQFGSNTSEGIKEQQDTITLDDVMRGSTFVGLRVTKVDPTGPLGSYYGLKTGDVIKVIGDAPLDMVGGSETARGLLLQAKMERRVLTVVRNNQEIKLEGKQ